MPKSSPTDPASCPAAPEPELRAQALQAIRRVAVEQLERAREPGEHEDLQRDLQLDSLELMTLAVALEDRFRVRLQEEDSRSVRTVGELAGLVARRAAQARR